MRLLLSAVLVACTSAAASAQIRDSVRADSVRRLGRVVVSESRLGEIGVTSSAASVNSVDLRHAPAGPTRVADALARLPGIASYSDQGNRTQPTLDIRGFTLSPVVGVPQGVSVFLDGVRLNEPDAQEVNFDLIPAEAIESARLIRGASAEFGKNTLAGALNLTTIRGTADSQVETGASAGSFGYRDAHVIASGMLGAFDGAIAAHASDDAGYQQQSGGQTRRVLATVGRRADSSDVALSLLYAHNRLYEAGSLPASWLAVARRANYTGGDFFKPDAILGTLRVSHESANGLTVRGNLFARRNAIQQFNVNVQDPNTRAFITNTSAGGAVETSFPGAVGMLPFTATLGAEAASSGVSYRLFGETTNAGPALPGDCDRSTGICEDARVPGQDGALYAQLVLWPAGRTSMMVSARGDVVRVPFRDRRDPANDGNNAFAHVSPKLGIVHHASESARLYASAGSGFRAPAALELACASPDAPCPLPFSLGADPALAPVVAWNYESGLDWTPSPRAQLHSAVFRTDVRDEIAFMSSSSASGYFQNIHRTRRQGLELSGDAQVANAVRAFASYSYLDATYESRAALASALDSNVVRPGDRMALSPRHRATGGVSATRLFGSSVLSTSVDARVVSSQLLRGDEAGRTAPLPAYGVADVHATLERARFAITLDVSNVFDRRYTTYGVYAENPRGSFGGAAPAEPGVERFLTPALPRTFSISAEIRR